MGNLLTMLTGSISGPWTATRLGTAALSVVCFVCGSLLPAKEIAAGVTAPQALAGLGILLVGIVLKGPGQSTPPTPPTAG